MGILVDTNTAVVYRLQHNNVTIASHSLGERSHDPSVLTHDPIQPVSHDSTILLEPITPGDHYNVEFKVQDDGPAVIKVMEGVCNVNGVQCDPNERRRALGNGSFIELGSSYRLQYQATPTNKPHPQRVLPPTPGSSAYNAPPTKPTRQTSDESVGLTNSITETDEGVVNSEEVGVAKRLSTVSLPESVDLDGVSMDRDLRSRLKRIAQEINARSSGYKERRPPPPYEQVANSINYQLLHQNHPSLSSKLIDSLYPTLKEMEKKDHDLDNIYSTFLSSYCTARGKSATPTCMLPADLPVVQFVMEMILHMCCMPDTIPIASKHCPLWMHLLAIFSQSSQNQSLMVDKKYATPILSCMHLSLMSGSLDFQQHGWTVLGNVVATPTQPGRKPVLLGASLTLALSLIDQQLSTWPTHLPLMSSLLHTLSQVAGVAKSAISAQDKLDKVKGDTDVVGDETVNTESVNSTYSQEEGAHVLHLLHEHNVLRQLMRVPPHLRAQPHFHDNYCTLVKALVPIKLRKRGVASSAATPPAKPPRKPERMRKLRCATIATVEDDMRSKVSMDTPILDHVTHDTESNQSNSSPKSLPHTKSLSGLPDHIHLPSYKVPATDLIGSHDPVPDQSEPLASDTGMCNSNHSNQENLEETTKPAVDVKSDNDRSKGGVSPISIEERGGAETDEGSSDQRRDMGLEETESSKVNDVSSPQDDSDEAPMKLLVAMDTPQIFTEEVQSPTESTNIFATPPSSHKSDTLSRDVQSLLDTLRAPLPIVACEGGGAYLPPVHIPIVSRGSRYYRHSVKKRRAESRKEVGGDRTSEPLTETKELIEVGFAEDCVIIDEVPVSPAVQSPSRMQWGDATPPSSILPDSCSLFEVSGEFLSPSHTALEEIASGHADVMATLGERAELLEGVLDLWSNDKGLQAATNTLQGCFSDGTADLPLFMDILQSFLQNKSPWTLAVCIVLLPALQQVIHIQRDGSCVLTVCNVLLNVVERFSDLILACKAPTRSRTKRISTLVDRQQQVVCYNELHSIRDAICNRLDMNFDPKKVANKLRKVHSALKPYKQDLCDS